MKGYKIFFAWFLSVTIGSIGLPIWFELTETFILGGNRIFHLDYSDLFLAVLACMIVSGLISLPTIVTLIVSNIILKRKNYIIKQHFKKINFIHFIMALLTLIVAEGWMLIEFLSYNQPDVRGGFQSYDLMPLFWFFLVMIWYVICTFISWYLIFKKVIRMNEDDENLDTDC